MATGFPVDSELLGHVAQALTVPAATSFLVQYAAGVPAAVTRLQYWFDLTGSATFIILTLVAAGVATSPEPLPAAHLLVAGAVTLWAIRLGTFLFTRIVGDGGIDHRMSKFTKNPIRFLLGPWTVQGVWVLATMLPAIVLLAGRSPAASLPPTPATWRQWLTAPVDAVVAGTARLQDAALALQGSDLDAIPPSILILLTGWAGGWIVQTLADEQKRQFKADANNAGRYITEGLWGASQHPNYAGEMVLWLCLGGAAAHLAFLDPHHLLHGSPLAYASLVGPLLEACLLMFLSGVPLLDKAAALRWGEEDAWRAYATTTPVVFPCCPAWPRRPTAYPTHSKDE